jgi:aminoglycoside phosphotransferase family enzyme
VLPASFSGCGDGGVKQDDVIRRLSTGEGLGGVSPERIDTHISTIFLVGDDVYKLKRALATSYLDYSSLEDRRRFCLAELDINRRTAPQIYLNIVPVRLTPGDDLIIGDGPGPPVEWLVHMRRFPQEALFDRLADDGGLTQAMMIGLADEIAAFHENAEISIGDSASQSIAAVIEENAAELMKYAGGPFDRAPVNAYIRSCRALYAKHKDRIDRRGSSGFVRHCHGDLHLRNICLFDGKPTLFDAIEFSDEISHIDVLFDLAFLLMDLEHRGLRSHANTVFNRYLYRTEDIDDLALLPLYLALRAGIRAHTSAMASAAAQDGENKEDLKGDAANYLRLGLRLLEPDVPSLTALGGLSGVGKSTLAQGIAPHRGRAPGALILSSDLIRKRLMGVEPLTKLSETAYVGDTNDLVYEKMMDCARRVLENGHSTRNGSGGRLVFASTGSGWKQIRCGCTSASRSDRTILQMPLYRCSPDSWERMWAT